MIKKSIALHTAMLSTACLLSGCGGGHTVTLQTKEGSTVQATTDDLGTYPQDFPLPKYPDAKVKLVTTTNDKSGTLKKGVFLSTNDKPDKITEFYKEQLNSGGWTIDSTTQSNQMVNMVVSRGDTHALIMIMSGQDQTSIQIQIN